MASDDTVPVIGDWHATARDKSWIPAAAPSGRLFSPTLAASGR
jgi:hypothetical protein